MSNKENDIKERKKELKQTLSTYGNIPCISYDLRDTDFNVELYGNDLMLYRSQSDQFIYIHDRDDESNGKVSMESLKIILSNIASREIEEKYEREALELFLSTEEDE